MKNDIEQVFNEVSGELQAPAARWITPYEAPSQSDIDAGDNQFILFAKPEATDLATGVNIATIMEIILGKLEEFQVRTGGIRVVNGTYLARHSVMDQHYGVINQISKGGRSAISDRAAGTLVKEFGGDIESGAKVLGAHEFLEAEPEFTPLSLCVLNDNLPTHKLAGGTYACNFKVVGHPYIVLNSFHPYQLVPYTSPGRGIVIIEGRSATSWADLRGKLAGATNPEVAEAGSIRQELLHRKADTGMIDVSQGANGIHLSAGPLEGMVELQRFFTDHESGSALPLSDTCFGGQLLSKGLDAPQVDALAENPDLVHEGKPESAFDLTEEMDCGTAAELLAGATARV